MAQRRTPTEQHSTDHKIGQETTKSISTDGDALITREGSIETVEGPGAVNKADQLAFNEEIIKIMVHETTDPSASAVVYSGVNGKRQFFIRGKIQEVRRKYVESLARAKQTGYRQLVSVNEATGNVTQKMIPHIGLKYPFSVIEDRNPNGAAWLRQVLNEA